MDHEEQEMEAKQEDSESDDDFKEDMDSEVESKHRKMMEMRMAEKKFEAQEAQENRIKGHG